MSLSQATFRKIVVEAPQRFVKKSHVAMMVDSGNIVEASIGKGVYKMTFDAWSEKNDFDVYRVKGATPKQRKKAVAVAKSMVGKGYSLLKGIRAYFMPRKHKAGQVKEARNETELFCSTVVAAAYPQISRSIGKHPSDILPIDIIDSPQVTKQ